MTTQRQLFWIFIVGICLGIWNCDTSLNVKPHFSNSFYKLIGIQGDQIGADVKQTPDGGYVIVGSSDTTGFDDTKNEQDVFLVRTDNLGNEIYHRSFGGPLQDDGVAIEIDASGDFIIAANSIIVDPADGLLHSEAVVYRVPDDEFAPLDSIIFDIPKRDISINSLSPISTGYIISGYTTKIDSTGKSNPLLASDIKDIYSAKIDANLMDDPLWDKIIGFDGEDIGVKILEQTSGSFVFFATTDKAPPANSNFDNHYFFNFRTNVYGVPLGNEVYAGTLDEDFASGVAETFNNSYAIIGTSNTGSGPRIYISRLKTVNNAISLIEGYSLSVGSVEGISIIENTSQNFYIVGNKVVSTDDKDIYLAQITKSGVLIWDRSFGGEGLDQAGSVIQSSDDGGVVLTGSFQLDKQFKVVLIKTGPGGEMSFN